MLHLEIIEERLDREFYLGVITTAPSVFYKVYKTDVEMIELYNPEELPKPQEISYIEEPYVTANILTPKEYVGNIMELCQRRRGIYIDMKYLDENSLDMNNLYLFIHCLFFFIAVKLIYPVMRFAPPLIP